MYVCMYVRKQYNVSRIVICMNNEVGAPCNAHALRIRSFVNVYVYVELCESIQRGIVQSHRNTAMGRDGTRTGTERQRVNVGRTLLASRTLRISTVANKHTARTLSSCTWNVDMCTNDVRNTVPDDHVEQIEGKICIRDGNKLKESFAFETKERSCETLIRS
jgi:hypothetical protein